MGRRSCARCTPTRPSSTPRTGTGRTGARPGTLEGRRSTPALHVVCRVVSLFTALASDSLSSLVLDDLQWADNEPATTEAHHHFRTRVAAARCRDLQEHEASSSSALVELLGALRRLDVETTRIELSGLDDTGVALLMEGFAGHALDPAALRLADAVSRETNGNPSSSSRFCDTWPRTA